MNEYKKQIEGILEKRKQWQTGSRVINCTMHSGRSITERPDDCRLCLTDLRNHMNLAIRMNEFLNEMLDELEGIEQDK